MLPHPYFIIGALLLALGAGGSGYLKGRSDCSARYEYTNLKSERDALRRQMQVTEDARAADARRLADNAAELAAMKEKAEDDAQTLADRDRICFDPADTDSLRQHFRTAR